jgi:hypothetical protein
MPADGQQYNGSGGFDARSVPPALPEDCHFSRRIGILNMAAPAGGQRRADEAAEKIGTELSLEQITEPDEESAGPRRDFGGPDLRLTGSLDRVNLQRAVEQLPPGYKAVFVLHDVEGYEHNEIAGIMGCSIGNSKSQLHKARMRLRDLLHEVVRAQAREERKAAGEASAGKG